MKTIARCLRPALAAVFALALSGASALASTVAQIRENLSVGDYPAAVASATATLASSGLSTADQADARFFRAYARLLDTIEKEAPALVTRYGGKTEVFDLFTGEVEIEFPNTVLYSPASVSARFVRSGPAYTLPAGYDSHASLTFSNTGFGSRDISLRADLSSGIWISDIADAESGDVLGSLTGFTNSIEGSAEDFSFNAYTDELTGANRIDFTLDVGDRLSFRIPFTDGNLKLSTIGALPSGVSAVASRPFTRSGSSFSLKADFFLPEPAASFENRGTATQTVALEFSTAANFSLNLGIDADSSGFLTASNNELFGDTTRIGSFDSETGILTVQLEPGQVLSLIMFRADPGFSFRPLGTLPKTLLATNGAYATDVVPKFAKGSSTGALFTALTRLDTTAFAQVVADLSAIPAGHETVLGSTESLSGRLTLVQQADREVTLGLLKFIQSFGLLSRVVNLGFDFSSPSLFGDGTDPLKVLNSAKSLLASGKATAAERTRLRDLLSQTADHFIAASDAGIDSRVAPPEGEYIFDLDIVAADSFENRILEQEGVFTVASQINFEPGSAVTFRNTTEADLDLVLAIGGYPADPAYFQNFSDWLSATVLLDGEFRADILAGQESFGIGRDVFDQELGDFVREEFGVIDPETETWTVTIPAGQSLVLDFLVAAPGVTLTPVESLPVGIAATLGQSALVVDDLRARLVEFKQSLTAPVPSSAFGLGSLGGPGQDATFTLAPLFSTTKPFNLRALLPEITDEGVRRGTSLPLVGSGLFGGVNITGFETYLANRGNLDRFTAPRIVPLRILAQPASVTLDAGASHTLSVSATGYPVPEYQWVRDGVPLENETGSTLLLTEADAFTAGAYQVRITGGANTFEKPLGSALARVAVRAAPVVVTPPSESDLYIPASSGSVTLSVSAIGFAPLRYQWFRDGVAIPRATGARFAVRAAAASNGAYHVKVTNTFGETETEPFDLVVLNVAALPAAPRVLEFGAPLRLSVARTGAPELSYQWQRDGQNIDFTEAELLIESVTGQDAGAYRVLITDESGTYASLPVGVAVNTAPRSLVVDTSLDFNGAYQQGEDEFEVSTNYSVTRAGRMSVFDASFDINATATFTYKRVSPNTGELVVNVRSDEDPTYAYKLKALLRFDSPESGGYSGSGSDLFGSFTESGEFSLFINGDESF